MEADVAEDALNENERTQLENGLIVLAHIIARACLKEQAFLMKEQSRKYSYPDLSPVGKSLAEQLSGKSPTMTVREAAELLGLSKNTTYEAINAGQIPHIKVGRRIIIPRIRLMELLLEKEPAKQMQ